MDAQKNAPDTRAEAVEMLRPYLALDPGLLDRIYSDEFSICKSALKPGDWLEGPRIALGVCTIDVSKMDHQTADRYLELRRTLPRKWGSGVVDWLDAEGERMLGKI